MADIVGISGIVYDFVSHVPNMPRVGETVLANGFNTNLGGKVANSLVQASLLGDVSTSLIGKVGDDTFGKEQIENLNMHGVNTDHVTISSTHPTSTAFICIDPSGSNQIVLASGADKTLSVAEIRSISEVISRAKVLMCCYEVSTEVCDEAFSIARHHNVRTLLVPAPIPAELSAADLPEVDILCANEIEAGQILGVTIDDVEAAERAVHELYRRTNIRHPIITLGEKGAVVGVRVGTVRHIPAAKVDPVDTTGAGDSFVGCLAHQMVTESSAGIEAMVTLATRVASMSTTKHGTRPSYPTKADLSTK